MWRGRIVVDSEILVGRPVVKGTRLAVEFIVELLAQGWTYEQILDNYPGLSQQDILACLSYASDALHAEKIYPLARTDVVRLLANENFPGAVVREPRSRGHHVFWRPRVRPA